MLSEIRAIYQAFGRAPFEGKTITPFIPTRHTSVVVAMHMRDLEIWHTLDVGATQIIFREGRPATAHVTLHWRHATNYLNWLYGKRSIMVNIAIRHLFIEGDFKLVPMLEFLERQWPSVTKVCQTATTRVQ